MIHRLLTWPLAAAVTTFALGSLAVAAPQDVAPPIQLGERLPASALSPGVVEGWDVVMERMANLPDDWDPNPKDRGDAHGYWAVPDIDAIAPQVTSRYAMNKWGDTEIGIAFGGIVSVDSVRLLGQGGAWARGVRVIGYRDGALVGATPWHAPLTARGETVPIALADVDRIVLEAQPIIDGAGWFGIDDLTFTRLGARDATVVTFDDVDYDTRLTGTDYAGLTWEEGTGDFTAADAVHAPEAPPGAERPGQAHGVPAMPGGGAGTLPVLGQSFQGVIRGEGSSSSYPPDTCGAIGPDHYVVVVNRAIAVYNRFTGARMSIANLGAFLPGSNGDPRVAFDQHSNRWIVLVTDFNTRYYLAVSTTDSATGSWYKTNFVVSQGSDSGRWPDYPTLGVDESGIYAASYMVGSGARMTIFAIEKAPLVASPPSLGAVTAFRNLPWEGAMQPVHDYDGEPGEWVVSRDSNQRLNLRYITGPITSPTLEGPFAVTIPFHDSPPLAPALGSTVPLNTVGPRLMNAVLMDGRVWTTHTIGYNGRAACRWYEIDAAGQSLMQSGTVSDPVRHYFFPSIAVNGNRTIAIGFSGSQADEYAGAYYTGRRDDDIPGDTAPPALLREGTAPQNNIDSSGRNRWGDYSLCTLDPLDSQTIWTIQEYAHSNNVWGTQVGELRESFAPANDHCVTTQSIDVGNTMFSTVGATSDGPDEPDCGGEIAADVWWKFIAPCTGTATIALCDADFDTRLAIYGPCPESPGESIACNDDACGQASSVTFAVSAGHGYKVRLGGAPGAEGTGTMSLTCTPDEPTCPSDLDGDGTVAVSDLLAVLGDWGGTTADVNEDGTVDVADLLQVLADWGDC